MSMDPESHELEVERVIAADPETVFDSFVEIYDGDDRPGWILSSEMDLRVGGEWIVELQPSGMKPFTEMRTITELDRPQRLAYSMNIESTDFEQPVSTEVGLSFEARSGQTLVKLDQRGFRSKQQADRYEQTWPPMLSLLSERAEG